jgi:hypothetical protein
MVVWEDIRNDGNGNNTDIFGARISPNGIVQDTIGIPISTALSYQWNPAVVFDGKNFLVVWEDYRNEIPDIYGTEVASNGVVLDPGGVLISEGSYPNRFPELTKVGDGRSLVVYQSFRPTPYGSDRIYGRLFESSVGVEEEMSFSLNKFRLFQNRPNPFNKLTAISYQIPSSNPASRIPHHVSLRIYDITGRLVEILVEKPHKPGVYQVKWDGKNKASGIYFYRLDAGNFIDTKKMIHLK